jgi:PAS domain S-box-containing protein
VTSHVSTYESLFENSVVPMMLLDLATATIASANPAAAAFYGYSREQMAGMSVMDIETMSPHEARMLMERQLADSSETGRVLRHRLADGSERDVLVHVGMLGDVDTPTAYAIVCDVTAQQAAFAELDEHRARLEVLLEERTKELDEARDGQAV